MAVSAREAAARAGSGDTVTGWKLDRAQRTELLQQFPPRYAGTVADHVTLATDASADAPLPEETLGEIVGCADDGKGVEAMVVRIGGTTDRPDGSTYHITWSLAEGGPAKESNDVIREGGWTAFADPIPVKLEPKAYP